MVVLLLCHSWIYSTTIESRKTTWISMKYNNPHPTQIPHTNHKSMHTYRTGWLYSWSYWKVNIFMSEQGCHSCRGTGIVRCGEGICGQEPLYNHEDKGQNSWGNPCRTGEKSSQLKDTHTVRIVRPDQYSVPIENKKKIFVVVDIHAYYYY